MKLSCKRLLKETQNKTETSHTLKFPENWEWDCEDFQGISVPLEAHRQHPR